MPTNATKDEKPQLLGPAAKLSRKPKKVAKKKATPRKAARKTAKKRK